MLKEKKFEVVSSASVTQILSQIILLKISKNKLSSVCPTSKPSVAMIDYTLARSFWNVTTRQHAHYEAARCRLPLRCSFFPSGASFLRPYTTTISTCNKYLSRPERSNLPNYYYILDVSPEADAKEIKSSYLRLAKKYHPDINKDANADELFKTLREAYDVLSDVNEKAFYDQVKNIHPNDHDSGVPMPPGYHMHPAYVARKEYDQASRRGARRGLYGALDVLFSRRGMYVLLGAPLIAMFYLGVSSLGPTKSELYESSLRSGWLDDRNVKYANIDSKGNSIDQGMNLVPAFWHERRKKWIRPDTWGKIQKIGAGRQLTKVREYKTRDDWVVPEGYTGVESERKIQEEEAQRADKLGIPRKRTDAEKERIVLARLKERNRIKNEKLQRRLKLERKTKRLKIKLAKNGVLDLKQSKPTKQWGLPAPK